MKCILDRCQCVASLLNTCVTCGRVFCDLHFFGTEGVCVRCADGRNRR